MADTVVSMAAAGGARAGAPRALHTESLQVQLVEGLRERLSAGEWIVGDRLPSEAELCAEYGTSRSTVRNALQHLAALGLTITRHGVGTFVSPYGSAIRSGLQRLRSMTGTIGAHGMEPWMDYRTKEFRGATAEEAEALGRQAGARVLATSRAVLADGQTVAYSYETIPCDVLPEGLAEDDVRGSLFALMEEAGTVPETSVAEIHAASGPGIGWGERDAGQLYVYLYQVHYDPSARPVALSRTYFHEGRFQFSVLRRR